MAFADNGLPLGPNGQFPPQRIGSWGNYIDAPMDDAAEQVYNGQDAVAKLPAPEMDYDSVVSRAQEHMEFGWPRVDKISIKQMQKNIFDAKDNLIVPGAKLRF